MQQYTEFVYTIACNVPNSNIEEGKINRFINRTDTKQKRRKVEKGYFYLENLSIHNRKEAISFNYHAASAIKFS